MALNFPDSPLVNDIFTSGNARWIWNGTSWVRQGTPGTQGSQGIQGAPGAGSQGIQGTIGAQGSQGIQGTIGAQGIQGTVGAQGSQGIQGTIGSQGVQGAAAAAGAQGSQGIQGAVGQGIQGVQGTAGSQGIQGSAGSGSESFASGTFLIFPQATAPTGWTKFTGLSVNDRTLRVVNGSTGGTLGGSFSFSSVFVNRPVSGIATATVTVSNTTLAASQIPFHTHNYNDSTVTGVNGGAFSGPNNPASLTGVNVGNPVRTTDSGQNGTPAVGNGSHSHGTSTSTIFSASSMEFSVGYIDVIICSKD